MNTSEVLNRAADLIEERGWWGNGPGSSQGSDLCLSNAIVRAGGSNWSKAHRALLEHIGKPNRSAAEIFRFNDAPERTVTEVIEALRATAVIEAARESKPAEVSA